MVENKVMEQVLERNEYNKKVDVKSDYKMLKGLLKSFIYKYKFKGSEDDITGLFISIMYDEIAKHSIRNSQLKEDYYLKEFSNPKSQLYGYFYKAVKSRLHEGLHPNIKKVYINGDYRYVEETKISLNTKDLKGLERIQNVGNTTETEHHYEIGEDIFKKFMETLNQDELNDLKNENLTNYKKVKLQGKLINYLIDNGEIKDKDRMIELIIYLKIYCSTLKTSKAVDKKIVRGGLETPYLDRFKGYTRKEMNKEVSKEFNKIVDLYLGNTKIDKPILHNNKGNNKDNTKIYNISPQGIFYSSQD